MLRFIDTMRGWLSATDGDGDDVRLAASGLADASGLNARHVTINILPIGSHFDVFVARCRVPSGRR